MYEQGAAATELYVLAEGEVALRLLRADGETRELERRRPVDVFGEAAIWDAGPRMVTAYTTKLTSTVVVQRETMEPLLGPEAPFVNDLLAYLAQVLRRANERLQEPKP